MPELRHNVCINYSNLVTKTPTSHDYITNFNKKDSFCNMNYATVKWGNIIPKLDNFFEDMDKN